jgi:hypothetical protein
MMMRDGIAVLASRLISYAAEEIATLGVATPAVVEQVSTLCTAWAARIAQWLHALITSLTRLRALAGRLHTAIEAIKARALPEDERNPALRLFGLGELFTVTFRFENLAEPETSERNSALMAHTLIAFAQRYGGGGVLLFNGERAVLQYGAEGVVFDSDWEDWAENPETAPLLAQFPSRVLDQPLL